MKLRLVVALLLACTAATAGAGDPTSPVSDCLEAAIDRGALVDVERLKCLESELRTLDRRIDLAATSATRAQRELAAALNDWRRHRTSWCAYRRRVETTPNRYVNEALCRVEMTQAKLIEVRSLHR